MRSEDGITDNRKKVHIKRISRVRAGVLVAALLCITLCAVVTTFSPDSNVSACSSYYTNTSLDSLFANSGHHGTSWNDAYTFNSLTYKNLEYGLAFKDTTRFVIIFNCTFVNETGAGVYFDSGSHLRVWNCVFSQCAYRIEVSSSQDVGVANCSISANETDGIYFDGVSNSSVTQNLFARNGVGFASSGSTSSVSVSLNNFTANAASVSDSTKGGVAYNISGLGNYWDGYLSQNPSATINLSRPIYLPGQSSSAGVTFVGSLPYLVAGKVSDADPLWYFPMSSPSVIINAPQSNQVFNHNAPSYSVTVSGVLLTGAWLTLDGAYSNTTLSSNFGPSGTVNFTGTFNPTAWAGLANGTQVVTASVLNWFGNIAQVSIVVDVELIPPAIVINSPVAGGLFGLSAPAYDLSIVTPYPSGNIWYSVNGSYCVNTANPTGTISPYIWAVLGSGPVDITFWSSDVVGNVGSATVCVTRSTEVPQISMTAPAGGQLINATPPVVSASAVDLAPVVWYCEIGSCATQYLLGSGHSLSAPVPATAWSGQPDGFVTLTVIAVDSLGNQNSTVVTLQKDSTSPTVTVAFAPSSL